MGKSGQVNRRIYARAVIAKAMIVTWSLGCIKYLASVYRSGSPASAAPSARLAQGAM